MCERVDDGRLVVSGDDNAGPAMTLQITGNCFEKFPLLCWDQTLVDVVSKHHVYRPGKALNFHCTYRQAMVGFRPG